ncbi:hypothetical protein DPEC_G00264760 [Dallia pectoralis]|uniref:Uncharacterized protein n=1 Tax=Dallia pectoralis TaxID=75939 RepID=A0ACC2FSL4_DALPE|nr:hypothetical protein DPEC_G00264760 [Dallia pectoralis]
MKAEEATSGRNDYSHYSLKFYVRCPINAEDYHAPLGRERPKKKFLWRVGRGSGTLWWKTEPNPPACSSTPSCPQCCASQLTWGDIQKSSHRFTHSSFVSLKGA